MAIGEQVLKLRYFDTDWPATLLVSTKKEDENENDKQDDYKGEGGMVSSSKKKKTKDIEKEEVPEFVEEAIVGNAAVKGFMEHQLGRMEWDAMGATWEARAVLNELLTAR